MKLVPRAIHQNAVVGHGGPGPHAMMIRAKGPAKIPGGADQRFIISDQGKGSLIRVLMAEIGRAHV